MQRRGLLPTRRRHNLAFGCTFRTALAICRQGRLFRICLPTLQLSRLPPFAPRRRCVVIPENEEPLERRPPSRDYAHSRQGLGTLLTPAPAPVLPLLHGEDTDRAAHGTLGICQDRGLSPLRAHEFPLLDEVVREGRRRAAQCARDWQRPFVLLSWSA